MGVHVRGMTSNSLTSFNDQLIFKFLILFPNIPFFSFCVCEFKIGVNQRAHCLRLCFFILFKLV